MNHFAVWHDKAGNAVSQPLAGVTDPETHLHFPDLNASGGEAMAAVKGLTADGLFKGQSADFFAKITALAQAADAAVRGA